MKTLKKVVGAIFVNKKDELLLQLRDDKPFISYPNHWSLLGGHIEKNESPIQGLRREIKEEINYNIRNPIFLDKYVDEFGFMTYLYKSKINKKIDELNLTEGQRLGYFKLENLQNLKMPEELKDFIFKNKERIFD